MRRSLVPGTLLSAGIGLVWMILYWRSDLKFALSILLYHIFIGFVLSAILVLIARKIRVNTCSAALLFSLIGLFWISPIILFNVDHLLKDLKPNVRDLLIVPVTVITMTLLGFFLGYSLRRFNPVMKASVMLVVMAIVPLFFLYFRIGHPTLNYPIVDRLNSEVKESAADARVMVLGIDGGTWDVIIPLLQREKLPNLKRLMEKGKYGILTSFDNSMSPVVWTSIFTGKIPEHHGITDWETSDSRNRFCKSVWNILNDHGQKAIVVNVPGTFPPEKINGAQISGFPIPGPSRPKSVYMEEYGKLYTTETRKNRIVPSISINLKSAEGWQTPPHSYAPLLESALPIIEDIPSEQLARTLHLEHFLIESFIHYDRSMKKTRIATLPILIADTTDDAEISYDTLFIFKSKKGREPLAVLTENRWSDWLSIELNRYDAEFSFRMKLIALSHNRCEIYATPLFQSPCDPIVPFISPAQLASELCRTIGMYVVEGVGWKMHLDEFALDLLYEHLIDVAEMHARVSEELLSTIPDWTLFIHVFSESDRIQHPYWKYYQPELFGLVDMTLGEQHGSKINSTIERIDADIGRFLSYTDEDTTVLVISDHGFHADPENDQGDHDRDGIFIFSGKYIKNDQKQLDLDLSSFQRADILDITPVILSLIGYPVAKDMDGTPRTDLFDESRLKDLSVQVIDSYENEETGKKRTRQLIDESTRDQLRSLGYIE